MRFFFKKNLSKIIIRFLQFIRCSYQSKQEISAKWIEELSGEDLKFLGKYLIKKLSNNEVNDDKLTLQVIKPDFIPSDRIVYTHAKLKKNRYLYVLKKAKLRGAVPLIFSKKNVLIKDSVFFSDEHNRLRSQLNANLVRKIINYFKQHGDKNLNYAVLMFSDWNHYGHWLPEHLLKLRTIEQFFKDKPLRDVKLVLESSPPEWKLQIIEKIGWHRDQVVEWKSSEVKVANLLVPSYPVPCYEDYKWLKDKLLPKITPVSGFEKIYLSREKYKNRKVDNEAALCKFLSDCGFEIVYPELLSFEQQFAIFINAKVIIGPHGSAFTNIIFSEHAKVVEFFGTRVPLNFYCYSLIMGHKYKPLFCKDSGELNSNIFVEINELKNLLDSF